MVTILGIAASLRRGSFNSSLLRAAAAVAPPSATIEIASIRDIPLCDGEDESQHELPEPVRALQERVYSTDALFLVTPDYDSSTPGVLKNALDWLSRSAADVARVFAKRPVAIIGATPGSEGTLLSQSAWLPIVTTLGMVPWFGGRVHVSEAPPRAFDPDGKLIDERIRMELTAFIEEFTTFVTTARPQQESDARIRSASSISAAPSADVSVPEATRAST